MLMVVMVMSATVAQGHHLLIVSIQTNHSKLIVMLEREINVHKGCPNVGHCKKDERHCCYLIKGSNKCYLDTIESEDFI